MKVSVFLFLIGYERNVCTRVVVVGIYLFYVSKCIKTENILFRKFHRRLKANTICFIESGLKWLAILHLGW